MVDREAAEQALARTRLLSESAEGGVRFDTFMRHDEVEAYINNVTSRHYIASRIDIGKTQEGRSLTVVRVAKSRTKKAKRAIVVDAGIHAREWIAPATALYLLNQLVENTQTHKDLLDGLDWYILPLVNPDGYEYSHTKVAPPPQPLCGLTSVHHVLGLKKIRKTDARVKTSLLCRTDSGARTAVHALAGGDGFWIICALAERT